MDAMVVMTRAHLLSKKFMVLTRRNIQRRVRADKERHLPMKNLLRDSQLTNRQAKPSEII